MPIPSSVGGEKNQKKSEASMSQVIVEVCSAAQTGGSTLVAVGTQKTIEVTSSGSPQSGKPSGAGNGIVTIHNNGTDALWVRFGGTAAVNDGHFMSPNSIRDFGAYTGESISIINDS